MTLIGLSDNLMGKQWIEERLDDELQIRVSDSIATAMYIRSLFPELTTKEVFEKLEDPIFLETLLEILEEV